MLAAIVIISSANTTANGISSFQSPGWQVTGNVSNQSGVPLQGVTIRVKGTSRGTISDSKGNFSIAVLNENEVFIFSYLGYNEKEVRVGTNKQLAVTLEVNNLNKLNDVVVIGYGTQKKSDLTGSVSQISNKQLEAVPVYNVEQALKARTSGIQITQNSGTPGGRIQVRIRGSNSMIGDNSPLYVVDGFPITGGISYLNPSDIQSIDILKDASATAIYGARGANGVVLITSKRGKANQKGRIELSSYYGFQKEINRYKVLTAKQYAIVANEWLKNEGLDPYFSQHQIDSLGKGTDWQDVIFQTAPVQSHTLTFSGGENKTRYSLSGNYFDQEGIVKNSSAKRGDVRANIDHEVNSVVTLAANITLGRNEINDMPFDNSNFGENGRISGHLSAPPTLPVYDENGIPTRIEHIYSFGSQDMRNPAIYLAPRKDRTLSNTALGNASVDFKINKNLVFKTLVGIEYKMNVHETFIPIIFEDDRGSASDGYSYSNSFLNENTLTYTKTFKEKHQLNIVGGVTYQTYMSRNEEAEVTGLANNITENYNLASASVISPPSNSIAEWRLLSALGRINYSYNNKYLITASMRADGSSRFGENNKWGRFPSAAIAWRVSEEPFIKRISLIDNLKLRASYGITGNTALSPYQSLSKLSSVRTVYQNQVEEVGYVPNNIANSNLKWETTAQTNFGLDLGIWKGRLSFTLDYYKKKTSNLLASVPLPTSTGFSSVLKNIGEIDNSGFEFSVNADILNSEFKWNAFAQVSTNKNKVTRLSGGSDIIGSSLSHPFNAPTNIARVGQPLGAFYGLIEDGLTDDGFIKYKDINGDGVVNTLDRVILGSPYPDYIYSLDNNFSFKNFDLNIFIEGVQGNQIFWATSGTFLNSFQRGHNQLEDLFGHYWTEENPDPHAKYPKISSKTTAQVSDRYVKDGSYARLKSITLTYHIPVQNISWLTDMQLYISGTNLYTLTQYPGLDPEVNTTGTDSQSVGARLLMGIDQGAYPTAKTITFGARITF